MPRRRWRRLCHARGHLVSGLVLVRGGRERRQWCGVATPPAKHESGQPQREHRDRGGVCSKLAKSQTLYRVPYRVISSRTFPWTTKKGIAETGWTIYEVGSILSSFPDTRSGGATWIRAYVAYICL
ncbi:hypothetical protein B0H13DRAFT_1907690 [Mycena leptocephala]|nr:hypothetical protein B0H13DRAFT_1907690 [Mycena leptocephala]